MSVAEAARAIWITSGDRRGDSTAPYFAAKVKRGTA